MSRMVTDNLDERERAAIIMHNESEIVAIDAALEAEAEARSTEENLKWQITRKREVIKMLQERVVAASTASTSRQKLVEELGGRLGLLTSELTDAGAFNKAATTNLSSRARDIEKIAAYESRFEQMIDWVLIKTLDDKVAARTNAALGTADESTLPRRVGVLFCPEGEVKTEAVDELAVRITKDMTFREVRRGAARYWGEVAEECLLEDQRGAQWPMDANVMREVHRYRGDQVVRLVRKPVDEADDEQEEGGELDEEEGEEEEPAVENLMALLNAASGEAGDAGGEGGEGGEGGLAPGLGDAAAMMDDDSDSDDDGKVREEYVEPPMNRTRLIIEMILHSIFLALFYFSCKGKRNIDDAFRLFQALQTVFIEEEFGDWNEKTFLDVATFGEMWDWADGVLKPGLFESDIDDEGNVRMYNRLVGGMRLRTMRVSNKSCELPSSIMAKEIDDTFDVGEIKDQAFVFPTFEGDGGGLCFGPYESGSVAKEEYGPCTAAGRAKLRGVEGVDIDKYNTSCCLPNDEGEQVVGKCEPGKGSGFQYLEAFETRAPQIQGVAGIYDGGGYVRDVVAPAAMVRIGKYALNPTDFDDAFNELKQYMWVDEQTRAVVISFSIYNGNFNLYAACEFLFEFTPGGTVLPSYKFRMLKFYLWEGVKDMQTALSSWQVILDMVVYLFVLKNVIIELMSWGQIRWRYGTSMPYLTNIWNMMEIINIVPFFISLAVRMAFMAEPEWGLYSVFVGRYQELGNLANLYATTFTLDSISILISVLKYFKYLRLSDATNMLWSTLSRAARDMFFFFSTLLLFLFAFMVIGMQMFGAQMEDFTTFPKSFSVLMQMLLGVVDMYTDLLIAAPVMFIGLGFFFFYIILMFLILINVFLAILNDAYSGVKGEMEERKEQRRIEAEEREAMGLNENKGPSRADKMRAKLARARALRDVARGRYHRFKNRVQSLAKAKKNHVPTGVSDF